jgi:hypothetical protein
MYLLNLLAASVICICAFICVLHPRIEIPSWSVASMAAIMLASIAQVAHQLVYDYTPSLASVWMHAGVAVSWSWHLYTVFQRIRGPRPSKTISAGPSWH